MISIILDVLQDSDDSVEEIKVEKKTTQNRNQYTKGKNNEVFRDK
jgi:hypothetical protein